MTYINAVKYILSLPNEDDSAREAEVTERMRTVCEALGDPQKKLKFVHSCGDVGKDSCFSMLESVLRQTPLKVGRCFLPKGNEPREWISINQKIISHAEFSDAVKTVSKLYKARFKDAIPTRREVMILAAMLHFAGNGCDLVLLEKSYDKSHAAAVTEPPLVSLLTPFLGREMPIALFEHLIPKGTAECVSSPQHKDIFNGISSACVTAGSRLTLPIYSEMEIKSITLFKTEFSYRGESYSLRSFSPCQTINAITAIEVVNALNRCGFSIEGEAVRRGLFLTNLDGKCETVSIDPTVIVSTSYKKDRIDTLVASLAQVKEQFSGELQVIADNECSIDLSALSYSLTAHEIPHLSPTSASFDDAVKCLKADTLAPPTLLLGSKDFITKAKSALGSLLGR